MVCCDSEHAHLCYAVKLYGESQARLIDFQLKFILICMSVWVCDGTHDVILQLSVEVVCIPLFCFKISYNTVMSS